MTLRDTNGLPVRFDCDCDECESDGVTAGAVQRPGDPLAIDHATTYDPSFVARGGDGYAPPWCPCERCRSTPPQMISYPSVNAHDHDDERDDR